jgi:4-hydroxy-3-polyprenylbenzoate decarboxylase
MAKDLRAFLTQLEDRGQLRRIKVPVDPDLEVAEIANRLLAFGRSGPAL